MDVTDEIHPYEILIRFGEDGAFKGAHQVRRRVTTLADGRRFEDVLPAEAIEPDGFAAVMGEAAAKAVAEATAAVAERAGLLAEIAALREALADATAERDGPARQGAAAV